MVTLEGASPEILRARQGLLRKLGSAELVVSQIQLIMDVPVMIERRGLFELWNSIGKLSQADVCRPQ